MKKLLSFFLIFSTFHGISQIRTAENWGFQIGISTQFGTHINQFGIKIQGYYTVEFVQINSGGTIHLTGKDLGNRQNFLSSRLNLGAVVLGGRRNAIPTFILDGVNHQTNYQYGVGYNYLWYFDNAGSSQRSGGMGFHIDQWSLIVENDFFGGQGKDCFRTSHAHINYHEEFINLGFHTHLWTGETGGSRRITDTIYPNEYKNLAKNLFGKTSHGLLYLSADFLMAHGNSIGFNFGFDHERARHILQNKMMHDKKFIPKSIRKTNPHYPMLDINGEPILDGSKPPPISLFLQLGLNRGYSY